MKIIINTGTHGDEKIGLRVAKEIKKLSIKNGEINFVIANERAFALNKRYIDKDLNRSFPGKKNGNYEERRAHELLPMIKSTDMVIDIHSTTSDLKDALVITHLDKKTRKYIEVISPKYVLLMRATKNNALISYAKVGLAFEYGKDKDPKTIKKVITGIQKLLHYFNMIESGKPLNTKRASPIFFNVYTTVPKIEGAKLNKKIKNYSIIKKGQVYATVGDKQIKAIQDFYPILFGQKNYETIFGFAATKMR